MYTTQIHYSPLINDRKKGYKELVDLVCPDRFPFAGFLSKARTIRSLRFDTGLSFPPFTETIALVLLHSFVFILPDTSTLLVSMLRVPSPTMVNRVALSALVGFW